jgi:hypothetical protein
MAEKGKKHKKEGQPSEGELQQHAIQAGLRQLIYSNPGLKKYSVLMMNNIDYEKINDFMGYKVKELQESNMNETDAKKILYKELANYAASGKILKDTVVQTLFDKGQEGGLDKSLLEKIVGFFKPNKFEGTEYFQKATNAYSDMYDILSQDEVAQKSIPELVKAAKAMKMYGFLDVALKNFKAHKVMDDKTYKMLSKDLYDTTNMRLKKGVKGLEAHILKEKEELEKEEKEKEAQKIAASVIGFLGVLLIIFNMRITGAVIGGDSVITGGIVGVFMLLFSLLLYFRPLKRTFKK